MRWLPNLLSLSRLFSSPLLAWLLLEGRFRTALMLIVPVGVTDWLDGYAARRLGAAGKTGVILDPLADKVLLVTLFVALALLRLIPLWMFELAIGRDLVIVIGAGLLRIFRNAKRFMPSLLGKISTFFQIVLVALVLLETAFPNPVFSVLARIALALSALFTSLSGLDYVRRGIEMAVQPAAPAH